MAWLENGKAAIDTMIEERPGDFVKVIASQMPRDFAIKTADLDDVSDEELAEFIAALRIIVGRNQSPPSALGAVN
jgi:hypothetical protein